VLSVLKEQKRGRAADFVFRLPRVVVLGAIFPSHLQLLPYEYLATLHK
jgi:hypothetical protein